jgi:hypothetical protein
MRLRVVPLLAGVFLLFHGPAMAQSSVTIPEPASLALLATGAGALMVYHWRRRK